MKILLRWIINALALLVITQVLPGFEVESVYYAFIAALILGLINAVIRPVLLILTLPINIITLGLFSFIINALLIWFVSSFIQGFYIDSFLTALAAAIILWAVAMVSNWLIKQTKKATA